MQDVVKARNAHLLAKSLQVSDFLLLGSLGIFSPKILFNFVTDFLWLSLVISEFSISGRLCVVEEKLSVQDILVSLALIICIETTGQAVDVDGTAISLWSFMLLSFAWRPPVKLSCNIL